MMITVSIIISLLTLFYLLGKAADLIIYNIKLLGEKLGIKIFFLGIILGFFTSLPEFAVGINATISNISSIAVGNLLGGIIVLFSLVLGMSAVLNRKIKTDGEIFTFLLIFLYFILPLFLGLSGYLGSIDGLIFIALYFCLLFYLYWRQKRQNILDKRIVINKNKVIKNIFFVVLGLTLVVVISNIIIRFTNVLLGQWLIPPFVVGLILFSLGTNLPEIIVTIRSWRNNIKDLSLSNLIGSGMANILILGFLIFLKPVFLHVRLPYYSLTVFMIVLFISVLIFFRTNKSLSKNEGLALLSIYSLFLISQLSFIFLGISGEINN